MKKILSSLFMKYIITFVGIMVLSNIIATLFMFFYFGMDVRLGRLIAQSNNTPPITNFAYGIGITTFLVSGIGIFIAVRLLVKPIKQISSASKQVAEGNFDIHIDVSGADEVAELAKNFNTMTEALSKNEYLHKDFVSNVSHEFKTPLTSLRGYAKLLKKPDLSEEKRQECLDIIISETDRLSKLSSDLLRLSEIENEVIATHKESFRVDEQIRDALVLLQNEWEKKNMDIDLEMINAKYTGDKSLIYQVWVNLISNAIQYSSQNGSLRIRLTQKSGILFEITDSGMGMTKEEQERIFERFYKADVSRNSSGTGLGLSICKKIVEHHRGQIQVKSEVGKGSTFMVQL